jgi:polar amino acid transport system substrate-binding protein
MFGRKMKINTSTLFAAAVLSCLPFSSANSADIDWLVHERPPFRMWIDDTTVTGLFVEQAAKVFREAGVSFEWRRSSASRTQTLLEKNRGAICSTGWFKTEKRQAYAKFSKPFYQGNGTGALVRNDHTEVLLYKTFEELLADKHLSVGVRRKWSYGKYFDALLEKNGTKKVVHDQTNAGSIAMLAAGRFDYLLISVDTSDFLMNSVDRAKGKLKVLKMTDAPAGDLRYIMCSNNVSDEIMGRLNDAIDRLKLVK